VVIFVFYHPLIFVLMLSLGMRKPYNEKHNTFTEDSLVAKEPIKQFQSWFDVACQTPNILEANAMCLSTASK
jgi:pyridoxamine 5'-phosphate oxidase